MHGETLKLLDNNFSHARRKQNNLHLRFQVLEHPVHRLAIHE